MRTLHHTLMGIGLVAIAAVSVVAMQPWIPAAQAQHSHATEVQHAHDGQAQNAHAAEAQEHFHVLVEELDLSEDQQHSLTEPFHEAFAAMQKLHSLHDVIAAELTDEQRGKLAQMIHEMLGAGFAEQQHGAEAPHGKHH